MARPSGVHSEATGYARSLLEASLDPLVTISPEGKITDVNEAATLVTGVGREELVGTDFSEYFTEPDKAREGYRRVFAEGAVTDYPLTIRRVDGALTDVLYNASVFKDAAGDVQGVFAAARDVTALKQASRYARSLLEASLDPLVTISPEGKITDVNEAATLVTGVGREELVGTDFSEYFTEPDKAREGYRRVFAEGAVTDYPLTIRRVDGALTDVLYNASVFKDADGDVQGVFAAARDVTESKWLLRELAAAKNFTDNLLQSSTKYSIVGMDLDRCILSWNEGAQRNYGYTAGEVIGEHSNLVVSPEDVASGAVDRLYAAAVDAGVAEGVFQRVRKDGSRFVASVTVTRRDDVDGNLVGYLLMSNDISEQMKAEAEVRAASQYARSLLEASLDPLVTISPEGKITDVNEATTRATGVARDELVGTDFADYFTDPDHAREGYRRVFDEGSVTDYPLTIREGGDLIPVLYNASLYRDSEGHVLGVFAAARDVSAQRKAEAELGALNLELEARVEQRTADLERSNKSLEAFTYSVSHDLRAPLRALSGFSEALLDDYGDRLDETGRDYAERVVAASDRMARLIDDLLHLSRISRAEMHLEVVDLSAEVASIAADLQEREPQRRVSFVIQDSVKAPADRLLIRTVLENLLENAWKFTAKRDEATIEFGETPVDDAPICCYVRDDGAGFDVAYVEKLFQPFQRLHSAREFAGTGIGLASARRIVERHGGHIWAEGAVDHGATISFTLDAKDTL